MRSATCDTCGTTWQCAPRGRVPKMCKPCLAEPEMQTALREQRDAERREAGNIRAGALQARMDELRRKAADA